MSAPRRTRGVSLRDIKKVIEDSIAETVPRAIRAEFLKLGLATDDDDARLSAQRDFAFLRRARTGAEAAEGLVGKRIVTWALGAVGLAAAAGVGAMVHGTIVHP